MVEDTKGGVYIQSSKYMLKTNGKIIEELYL